MGEDRRTSVGRTKTDFSKHTKTFPRKKLAVTTGKKLVDLRDAAFKLLFEVVKRRIISKVHPKHISIKHMVCRKCYITIEFSFPFFLKNLDVSCSFLPMLNTLLAFKTQKLLSWIVVIKNTSFI